MYKYSKVIVRKPGRSMVSGLGPGGKNPEFIDYKNALKQHKDYVNVLKKVGMDVTELEVLEEFPDSCFVEDPARIVDNNFAILCRPSEKSRMGEKDHMEKVLRERFKNIEVIEAPGTVEGGDVIKVGKYFYIGLSKRTNKDGARQFIEHLRKYGYDGEMIPVKEILHLKTGVSYLEDNDLLVSGEFINNPIFDNFDKIVVSEEESYAANCICLNGNVIMPLGYPKTKKQIEDRGYTIIEVDSSEYNKLDGGLTCLSLRY